MTQTITTITAYCDICGKQIDKHVTDAKHENRYCFHVHNKKNVELVFTEDCGNDVIDMCKECYTHINISIKSRVDMGV